MLNESTNSSAGHRQMSSTFSTSLPISPIWFQNWKPQTAIATFVVCLGLSILSLLYKSISSIKFKVLKPKISQVLKESSSSKLDEELDEELINRSETINFDEGHQKLINTPTNHSSELHLNSINRSSETNDDFLDYPSRSSLQDNSRSNFSSRLSNQLFKILTKTNLLRCSLVTIQAGLGYLLMLAVMTYNIYYFIAILIGTFIGEAIFGQTDSLSHDHA